MAHDRWCWAGVLTLLLLIFAPPDPADGADRPTGGALVFGVGSVLTITEFDGASLAYQRYLSDNLAWRLTVGLDLSTGETGTEAEGTGEYPGSYSKTIENWQHAVSLSSEWLAYRGSEVSLYFGGGPHVEYQSWKRENADFFFYPDHVYEYNTDRHGWSLSLGAVGVLGVQWAPKSWCALHAEYRVVAAYATETSSYVRERIDPVSSSVYDETRTTRGFEFESRSVSAGLSILF